MDKVKSPARNPDLNATDTMVRAMDEFGEGVDRVVVIMLNKDGIECRMLSNARSEPEMNGMLYQALNFQDNLLEDEE